MSKKKLQLNRVTLARLDQKSLRTVAGRGFEETVVCIPTNTCEPTVEPSNGNCEASHPPTYCGCQNPEVRESDGCSAACGPVSQVLTAC